MATRRSCSTRSHATTSSCPANSSRLSSKTCVRRRPERDLPQSRSLAAGSLVVRKSAPADIRSRMFHRWAPFWTAWLRGCPLIVCIVYWYTTQMLKSYRHKGVKQFAETGSKAGIQPEHANRLRRLLSALDAATGPANMNAPGYALHPLTGDLEGHWAVRVSGNWRLTFAFEGEDAILVDYQDYH